MADSRTTLLILIILTYFLFSNDGTVQVRAGLAREAIQNTIKEAHEFLARVGETKYGDIEALWTYSGFNGSNSTVFSHVRDYNWVLLPQVQARAKERSVYALGDWGVDALGGHPSHETPLLYSNITGDARGRWVRSKLASEDNIPALNFSQFTVDGPFGPVKHNRFDANFTGAAGDITIELLQKEFSSDLAALLEDGNITTITAGIDITEDGTEQQESLMLRGVQYTQLGLTVLTTSSLKFPGLFALPMFTLSEHTHHMSRVLLNQTISTWLQQSDNMVNPWKPDSSDTQNVLLKCELIVYLQQMPIMDSRAALISQLDEELRFPTGAPLSGVPDMRFSMLAYSPDCGYVLESEGPPDQAREIAQHLVGRKSGMLLNRARDHTLLYSIVVALQLVILVRQMREASTPSTRSRISFYTIAMIVFSDAFGTMNFITASLFIDSLWITILGSVSFALVNTLIFGMRFMSDIWAVHAPELRRREQEAQEATIAAAQEQQQAAITSARERQQANYDRTVETPATIPPARAAPRVVDFGSLPVFMPSDQAGLQTAGDRPPASRVPTFGSLYMRFSFSLIMVLIVSVSAISWSGTLRHIYFTLLSIFHVSVWIPQIFRNIQRNCRKALKWEFVLGQSILRLLPVAYLFGLEDNILNAKPHRITLAIIACWLWIQVVLLISQEIVGPRWLVRKDWVPEAWDYHPILRSDLEDSALPLGLADSVSLPTSPSERRDSLPKDSKSNGKRVFDCAICMQELEVPVVDAKDGAEVSAAASGSLMLARRQYMVTPCRHIFHSNCLEGWMKYRLQCPICREGLPPL